MASTSGAMGSDIHRIHIRWRTTGFLLIVRLFYCNNPGGHLKSYEYFDAAQSVIDLAKNEERDLSPEEETQVSENLEAGKKAAKREALIAEAEKASAESRESRGRVYQPQQVDLPKDEKRGYSLMRAVSRLAAGQSVDGLEGEISQELANRGGKETQGFFMPLEHRALDSTTGTGAVQTKYAPSFIDILRNKTVVMAAGAEVLTGLDAGTYSIPKQTAAGTAYWISENNDTTASNQTIGSVSLQPNTLSGCTEISRRFIKTSSIDGERMSINDLSQQIAIALDYACLYGDGTTQPITGILQDTNTNLVTVGDSTNGAYLNLSDLYDMEKEIAVDNSEFSNTRFVTGPKLRAWMKGNDVAAVDGTASVVTGKYMWTDDNTVIGYPAMTSNQIPEALTVGSATCSAAVLGAFQQMIIGFWGGTGVEILVDPYSLSKSGGIRIVALLDVDMVLRHATAFCRVVDAKNA